VLKKILGVVAGVIVGGVVVGLIEALGHQLFPLAPGVDVRNPKPGDIPLGAMLSVLVAWALGSLAGGWVAARFAGMVGAFVVGAMLMGGGVVNMLMIPSPLWFWLAGLLAFLPFAGLGARLARPRAATT
jgi:hypothetical protein